MNKTVELYSQQEKKAYQKSDQNTMDFLGLVENKHTTRR